MKITILAAICAVLIFSQYSDAQMPSKLPAKGEEPASQVNTAYEGSFNIEMKRTGGPTFDYEKALRESDKKSVTQKRGIASTSNEKITLIRNKPEKKAKRTVASKSPGKKKNSKK